MFEVNYEKKNDVYYDSVIHYVIGFAGRTKESLI